MKLGVSSAWLSSRNAFVSLTVRSHLCRQAKKLMSRLQNTDLQQSFSAQRCTLCSVRVLFEPFQCTLRKCNAILLLFRQYLLGFVSICVQYHVLCLFNTILNLFSSCVRLRPTKLDKFSVRWSFSVVCRSRTVDKSSNAKLGFGAGEVFDFTCSILIECFEICSLPS